MGNFDILNIEYAPPLHSIQNLNSIAEQTATRKTPPKNFNPDINNAPQVCLFQNNLKPTRQNTTSN